MIYRIAKTTALGGSTGEVLAGVYETRLHAERAAMKLPVGFYEILEVDESNTLFNLEEYYSKPETKAGYQANLF